MREAETRAVILAAGRGRRLGTRTLDLPKCMLWVGDGPLIEHQIEMLRANGIRRISVVVGHHADRIREFVGDACEYVENPHYADTNSLYSLWLTRDRGEGPLVVLNSDVLAHPEIYARTCLARGNALAYDERSGTDAEEMKVSLRGRWLAEIGKTISPDRAHGESIGMLRFDSLGAQRLYAIAHALIDAGRVNDWAPAALGLLAQRVPVQAIPVGDLPWIEVDFEQDFLEANDRVWPAIASRGSERLARVRSRSANAARGGVR